MIINKQNIKKLKCYYEYGTLRPDTKLQCIACKNFKKLALFFGFRGLYEICFVKDMDVYSGPCGRCDFPNCAGWILREIK